MSMLRPACVLFLEVPDTDFADFPGKADEFIDRYPEILEAIEADLDADHSADADGASDAGSPYLYTGRRLDAESGLMQYRHRYYAGGLGRFVSRDPAGYVDGYCLYEYVAGRPIANTDPEGQSVLGVIAAVAAGSGLGYAIGTSVNCGRCEARVMGIINKARRELPPLEFQCWQKSSGILTTCAKLCGRALEAVEKQTAPGKFPGGPQPR